MPVETLPQKHALIAPGQGNQEIGMGQALAERSSAARVVWTKADAALQPHIGYDFSRLVWHGNIEELTKTENAQPAVIIDGLARKAALEEFDLLGKPDYFAGNSLGFLTALHCAGSLSIPATVELGIGRGEAFKYAIDHSPRTTMLALVEVEPEIIEETRRKYDLETCLINTGTQIVLGGIEESVKRAVYYLEEERGLRRGVTLLNVDAAFHSKYMEPALPIYTRVVDALPIEAPKGGILIGASREAKILRSPDEIRNELISQLIYPENWWSVMHLLVRSLGVTVMTELNSVPRLTNMNISMFDPGKRPIRLATPSLQEGDRGITIAQRWQAA